MPRSMPTTSAGLLLYRVTAARMQVLLVHPGGPYWQRKDVGAWSIPKGELDADEDALDAARREFAEELGVPAPDGPFIDLGFVRQSGGKRVIAFAVAGDLDVTRVISNTFEMEWPPRSGRRRDFPEVDRAAWFDLDEAVAPLNPGQHPLLDRLRASVDG